LDTAKIKHLPVSEFELFMTIRFYINKIWQAREQCVANLRNIFDFSTCNGSKNGLSNHVSPSAQHKRLTRTDYKHRQADHEKAKTRTDKSPS